MANESNPGLFGGFQLPGLQMPAFTQTSMADNPVMNTLTGSMDFMKSLWGGSGNSLGSIAGFVAPTLDVEQLDRKITDLKAVEGWLQTNASMLRATIQALEVQRNTIVTLQSFSNLAAQQAQGVSPGAAKPEAAPSSVSPNWPMPPASAAPAAATRMREPEPDPDDMLDPEDDFDPEDDMPPEDMPPEAAPADETPPPVEAAAAPAGKRAAGGAKKAAKGEPSDETLAQSAALAGQATSASIQNATAWWNLLQDQFAKVAQAAAATGKTAPGAGAGSGKAGKKPTVAKPTVNQAAVKKAGAAKTAAKPALKTKAPKKAAAPKTVAGKTVAKSAKQAAAAVRGAAKPAPRPARKSGARS